MSKVEHSPKTRVGLLARPVGAWEGEWGCLRQRERDKHRRGKRTVTHQELLRSLCAAGHANSFPRGVCFRLRKVFTATAKTRSLVCVSTKPAVTRQNYRERTRSGRPHGRVFAEQAKVVAQLSTPTASWLDARTRASAPHSQLLPPINDKNGVLRFVWHLPNSRSCMGKFAIQTIKFLCWSRFRARTHATTAAGCMMPQALLTTVLCATAEASIKRLSTGVTVLQCAQNQFFV